MDAPFSQEAKKRFYINNFDLIRLFAALQVVHVHLITILGVPITDVHRVFFKFLGFFPGVPIFFFISGFLITRSWVGSKGLRDFFKKRALRIFPALVFSVVLAIGLVIVSGYYVSAGMNLADLLVIFISKVTFFQFYNLESLRGYGDGVFNGSLWTITVELQFYLLTPLLFILIHYFRRGLSFNVFLIGVFIVFYLVSIYVKYYFFVGDESLIEKLTKVSFIPWFYMFLLGALFQLNFEFFYKLLSGKFFLVLLAYVGAAAFPVFFLNGGSSSFGNLMNPVLFPLLAMLVFSAAYTSVNLSDRLLRGNDISYGAYIYHMPFINWLIYNSYSPSYIVGFYLLLFVVVFSILSWVLLEKPFLKLK